MSLLLDALKKAADDKEKKSKQQRASLNEIKTDVNDLSEVSATPNTSNNDFSLDEMETEVDDASSANDIKDQSNQDFLLEKKEDHNDDAETLRKGKFSISDDALSLLIYKTNRHVSYGRKILVTSVIVLTLFSIVAGGFYYYTEMEDGIQVLERKHTIAMQAMRSKTNNEKTPEKTEIIRNLVSDAELEAKILNAKQKVKKAASVKPAKITKKEPRGSKSVLLIERTNKKDPVGEMLASAWQAYESGRYLEAKKIYKTILTREAGNRDALLGLGAIAVIEKDIELARRTYAELLNLDPRDSIAIAALAGLHSNQSSLATDEKYLLSMLNKNPEASHLNFALGNTYAKQKKWESAQQYYFNAWQYDDENADYLFNLAVSMDQLNKQKQAVDFYTQSLQKASNKQVSFSREAVQKRINELTRL